MIEDELIEALANFLDARDALNAAMEDDDIKASYYDSIRREEKAAKEKLATALRYLLDRQGRRTRPPPRRPS